MAYLAVLEWVRGTVRALQRRGQVSTPPPCPSWTLCRLLIAPCWTGHRSRRRRFRRPAVCWLRWARLHHPNPLYLLIKFTHIFYDYFLCLAFCWSNLQIDTSHCIKNFKQKYILGNKSNLYKKTIYFSKMIFYLHKNAFTLGKNRVLLLKETLKGGIWYRKVMGHLFPPIFEFGFCPRFELLGRKIILNLKSKHH